MKQNRAGSRSGTPIDPIPIAAHTESSIVRKQKRAQAAAISCVRCGRAIAAAGLSCPGCTTAEFSPDREVLVHYTTAPFFDMEKRTGEFSQRAVLARSERRRRRRTVAAILEAYDPNEVNWSMVANVLGVSRQAVHQLKQRIAESHQDQARDSVMLDMVPLHRIGLERAGRPRQRPTTAIVLAGGSGTRLRPLTYSCRKELIPLLNRPLLEYRLLNLKRHGISDVVVACAQGSGEVEEQFADGSSLGLHVKYSYEHRPLGSGRAVKNAVRMFGITGSIIVCNGDILTNINITEMMRRHVASGAAVSISLTRVDDPAQFGVVAIDSDFSITRFVEKPPPGREPSNLINSGTWIWEPEVLDRIPDDDSGVRDGFAERALFPQIIEEGLGVQGFIEDDIWLDIGSPERYLRAMELLLARVQHDSGPSRPDLQLGQDVQCVGNVMFGSDVRIGARARIVEPVVIGDRVVIGEDAVVEGSAIWEQSIIGAGSRIVGSVVGRGVNVGERVSMIDAVVADEAVIGSDRRLRIGARIDPREHV